MSKNPNRDLKKLSPEEKPKREVQRHRIKLKARMK